MKRGGIPALATALVLTGCAQTLPPSPDQTSAHYSSAPTIPKARGEFGPAIARMADTSRPWVLAVLGDSTGDAPDEWVHKAVTDLATRHGRPAIIHDWSIHSNSYAAETSVPGAGQPIVVWNGSASGKDPDYSRQHIEAMVPEQPDVLIVSHGHNVPTSELMGAGAQHLIDWSLGLEAPPAAAVVLQNPRTDGAAERQRGIVESLRQQWTGSGIRLIDVFSAFSNSGEVPSLLQPDGLHPSEAGSDVWAATVVAALTP